MHVIRSLCIAFSTYSRIPVPQVAWTDENRKYSMCFFPLIGAVIGLLLWGWLALCDVLGFGALLRGAVGALLPILVTGGIHMTALAPMMIGCFMLSRACSAWAMSAFRSARPKGMLDAFAQAAQRRMLTISCAVYAVLCEVVWAIISGWLAFPGLLAAILCVWYYRRMSYKQFGGITGDLAGWFLQITELTLTAVIVIGGKLL